MTVLFVGDQPSTKNLSADIAFVGTQSHVRLLTWLTDLGLDESQITLINRTDNQFEYLVQQFSIAGHPIVALGREASKALAKLDVHYWGLPHPSGRNRLLNDKIVLAKKLAACKTYIHSHK